jgi:type IV secretory pathway component VirB8
VDIQIGNVAIEDLREPPYRASVEFEKIFRAPGNGRETRRERYVAHFVFTVLPSVPNNFIPVNPLGLVITYFRQDQGF